MSRLVYWHKCTCLCCNFWQTFGHSRFWLGLWIWIRIRMEGKIHVRYFEWRTSVGIPILNRNKIKTFWWVFCCINLIIRNHDVKTSCFNYQLKLYVYWNMLIGLLVLKCPYLNDKHNNITNTHIRALHYPTVSLIINFKLILKIDLQCEISKQNWNLDVTLLSSLYSNQTDPK